MAEATIATDSIQTVADLVDRLGGVPLDRIRTRPAIGTATIADVERIANREGRLCELIDGVLVEKAMGYGESAIAGYIVIVLGGFVLEKNLGLVAGADGILELLPDLVRIPDVLFISWDRLPDRRRPTSAIPKLVPNLAIEVLSQSNPPREMALKRMDYFAAGVELVWEIDPNRRTVREFLSPDDGTALSADEALSGRDVIPGFTLPVAELWAELDRHG